MRPAAPPAQLNLRGGVAFRAAARLQRRGPRRAPASGRRRGRAAPAPLPRLRRGPCGAVPGAPCQPAHGAAASLPSGAPCRPAKGENANLALSVNRGGAEPGGQIRPFRRVGGGAEATARRAPRLRRGRRPQAAETAVGGLPCGPHPPPAKNPAAGENPLTLLFYDGRMKLNSKPLEPERSRIWNCPRKNYPMPSWT